MKPPPTVKELNEIQWLGYKEHLPGQPLDCSNDTAISRAILARVAVSVPHLEYRKDFLVVVSRHLVESERDDCRAARGRCAWEANP